MVDDKTPTHTAFALKRESKKYGRWLEIGNARVESDGVIHVFIDRTPVGGFNGYVYLSPTGVRPPNPEPTPQRPIAAEEEEATRGNGDAHD